MVIQFAKLAPRPLVYEAVQESIKAYIIENKLQAGDPLSPETHLAKQLGVSRNSLREAVKALESAGVLELRRGSGIFVREFSLEPLLENLPYGLIQDLQRLTELLEIRQILETGMIERAILTMSSGQLNDLNEVLERMRKRAYQGQSFAEEDREFHRLLFQNLNNQMLLSLIDIFWLAFHKVSGYLNLRNQEPLSTYRDHVAIFEAVKANDVKEARATLDRHYRGIRELVEKLGGNY